MTGFVHSIIGSMSKRKKLGIKLSICGAKHSLFMPEVNIEFSHFSVEQTTEQESLPSF